MIDFGNGPEEDNIVFGRHDTSNDLVLEIWRDGTAQTIIAADGIINDEWHVYAATIGPEPAGTPGKKTVSIYRDGVVIHVEFAHSPRSLVPRRNFYIARSNSSDGSGYFNGTLGYLAVYQTSLEIWHIFFITHELLYPVVVLKFNVPSGVMQDYSNSQHDATISGTPAVSHQPNGTPALAFNAAAPTKQYLSLANAGDFQDLTGGFTVIAAARFKAPANWERLMDFGAGAGSDNVILTRAATSNALQFESWIGETYNGVMCPDAIIGNEWHVYAVVLATGAEGQTTRVMFYRDGVPLCSGNVPVPRRTARAGCYVARSNWTDGSEYFNGELGYLAIYKNAQTEDRIRDISRTICNPAIILRFDTTSGTLNDATNSGHDATIYGTPTATTRPDVLEACL